MGNVILKKIDFKTNKIYKYEEKRMHINETRIISVHIFRKSFKEKSESDYLHCKNKEKTMFFIHGVAGSSLIWWQQIDYFVDLDYKVISIDLLGHGSSFKSKMFNDYEFLKLANDCLTIFDYFYSITGSNVVIGHSYGCSMATFIAHDRPYHVNRLILISGGSSKPLGDPDNIFNITPCCLWCLHPVILSVFRSRAFNSCTKNFSNKMLSIKIDSWVLKAIILGQVWDEGNTDYHKKITTPTLLIHGEDDEMVIIEDELDMLQAIPKCNLKRIPGVGHMAMLTASVEVNNAILYHILRDWESLFSTPKSLPISQFDQVMTNQSSSKIFRSFSLLNKSTKVGLKFTNNGSKDYAQDRFEDVEICNRKTLPSGILVRRKSTRLSFRRINSRRSTKIKSSNLDLPVQNIIPEEVDTSKL